jgi:hypothetical protein
MQIGIHENPNWYGNLTASSSVNEFQQHLHDNVPQALCPQPCESKDSVSPRASFVDQTMATESTDLKSGSHDQCKTAVEGDACHKEIVWAMQTGIQENPSWYTNLTPLSSAKQFQQHLHDHVQRAGCPAPCEGEEDNIASAMFLNRKMTTVEEGQISTKSEDFNSSKSEHATLSAAGMQRVLESNDLSALEEFVERLIRSDGREVRSQSGLKDFVEQTFQRTDLKRDLWDEDFEIFRTKVRSVAWVDPGIGRMAALTAPGYEQVVATNSRQQLANYFRRMVDKIGKAVTDQAKFARTLDMFTNTNMTFVEAAAMMAVGSFAQPK